MDKIGVNVVISFLEIVDISNSLDKDVYGAQCSFPLDINIKLFHCV